MNVQNLFQQGLKGSLIGVVALISSLSSGDRTLAQMTQQELDVNGVTVVASPYQGGAMHQLLIVEQLTNARACWSEQKNQTAANQTITVVNPLLADFDFSGICGRATDSNGFSVRMGGRDFDWRYTMQVVAQNGDLRLMARSTIKNQPIPDLLVGRVGGLTSGFAKINLEPGWRVTRRVAQGQLTGHFYLTSDRTIEQVIATMQPALGTPITSPEMTPMAPVVFPIATPVPSSTPSSMPSNQPLVFSSPTLNSVPPSPEVLK